VGWTLHLDNFFIAVRRMPIRFFVGHEWLAAGEHKIRDAAWMSGAIARAGFFTRVWPNNTKPTWLCFCNANPVPATLSPYGRCYDVDAAPESLSSKLVRKSNPHMVTQQPAVNPAVTG